MNKARLKSYAPAARREFIQAVTDRAHFFGLSEKEIVLVEEKGDLAIIGGRPFPKIFAAQRKKLEERVRRDGFNQVMEAVAYTWFNRFLALRFMELHGYLEHGFRVLSNPSGSTIPEILDHATQIELPGLDKQKVVELKLDGSKDAELYRIILVAQCNALNAAMPFLFEKIDDETELLLPDNLLHSDSLIRKLITGIDENDWQEVEIIGWLYQFYISEKKDQVIGKVVKSEDIPAATQLFTPNWIVKYMVQNSLGRQWLATYPDSPLKAKMAYYIEPAEQTDEVKAQLAAITPESLDPEKLTLLDPASGSGHILVEAYDLLKEIYLERGYSSRDFPRLILEKNLYGLDIDDRAAQMAGFALLMKARKDDRRIMRSDDPVKLNVMAIQESGEVKIDDVHWGELSNSMRELGSLFKNGKTFGSLIQVPENLSAKLPAIEDVVNHRQISGDLFVSQAAYEMMTLVVQAKILSRKYDCVVANPPYMGIKYYDSILKKFIESSYKIAKGDLYTCFMVKNIHFVKPHGLVGMITIPNWMFISTFEQLRTWLFGEATIETFCHNGRGIFGSDFGSCAFTIRNYSIPKYEGTFKRLFDKQGSVASNEELNDRFFSNDSFIASSRDFGKIDGFPVAYWMSQNVRNLFSEKAPLRSRIESRPGLSSTNNERFLRLWYEVGFNEIGIVCLNREDAIITKKKWFPFNKGGDARKWYGNNDFVVNWENDGEEIKKAAEGASGGRVVSEDYYFKASVSASAITSAGNSYRYYPPGAIFDVNFRSFFDNDKNFLDKLLGFLNSKVVSFLLTFLSPTVALNKNDLDRLPLFDAKAVDSSVVNELVQISKNDWDAFETSRDFRYLPLCTTLVENLTKSVAFSWLYWEKQSHEQFNLMKTLEEKNNLLFIDAYGLRDELAPEISEEQITIARADREGDMKRLISYTIGCMMGRYSLDQPGLVYANSGNIGFDQSQYQTFLADDDGIVPVMDMDWFPDDATSRFEELLKVAWSLETLEENLKFVADSLSPRGNETPRETIRRYMSTQFYKDHLQTYKKRPIYWLFSSGKLKAFECLVYLHRYNETTLSRMRNEYVTPLMGKFSAQIEYLANEKEAASSTAERNKLQKQLDALKKKQAELSAFDDLLRHYADQRISLDLDDGVKVNYGKFGNLLAEVKAVTGGEEA